MHTNGWILVTVYNPVKGEESLLTSLCENDTEAQAFADRFWSGEKVTFDRLPGTYERDS